jgi:predicted metalloprotease with PDZ domain
MHNNSNTSSMSEFLKPVARLCTIMKNANIHSPPDALNNIGFGVHIKQTSTLIPNYLRVSIVNYKSPAYLAGLEAGDYIIEINGRNILQMSHDEALHFIKSSFEINNQVRLLVCSEFCYNWLREHSSLFRLSSEDPSVFSYADYLKNNHRYAPRLSKIRTFAYSKSFGICIETFNLTPPANIVPQAVATYAHLITSVDSESPAAAAGIHKNDRIIECDGVNVEHENERQISERIYQAFASAKQISLFVVDPETDRFFKSKCIKLHSLLPIVQLISNSKDI